MKFIFVFIALLTYNLTASQTLEPKEEKSPQEWYDYHIEKKKTNRTSAWIALGGGLTMMTAGIAVNLTANIFDNSSEGLALIGVGAVCSLASIPLFKSARKHENQAEFYLTQGAIGLNREFKFSGLKVTFNF